MKMPISASNASGKIRLYAFFNQKPEDIAKIQEIFQLRLSEKFSKEMISNISENIKMKPYLLREGNNFSLIPTSKALKLYRTLQCSTQEVIKFYNEGVIVAKQLNDQVGEGDAYRYLGNVYDGLGDYKRAIVYQDKALKIALELKDRRREGIAYSNLGIAYNGLGDHMSAILYHEKDLKIALELKDLVGEKSSRSSLGDAYHGLGDYKRAIMHQEKVLQIAIELKDLSEERNAHSSLGNAYNGLGDYKRAIMCHEKSLKISLYMNDLDGEGKAYGNLGNAYHGLSDYRNAVLYHEKDLKIALELKDLNAEGSVYSNLGAAYEGLGDYRSAIKYHEKGLKIAFELKDLIGEQRAYCNLGIAYDGLGDYKNGIMYHTKSLKIALKLKNIIQQRGAYGNLGCAHQKLGNYRDAIVYHEKALKIALELKDVIGERSAYGNLGGSHHKLKDYKSAITYQEKALKIALEMKDLAAEERAYSCLGNTYAKLGDYQNSITYYEKGLKVALELKDLIGEARAYCNLGNAYREIGDYQSAVIYHEKDLKIALELKHLVAEARAYNNLGNAYQGLKSHRRAEEYFIKNILISNALQDQVQEAKWQISLFEEGSFSYLGLEKALLHQGKTHEALRASDMRRARALSFLISKKLPSKHDQNIFSDYLTIQKIQALAKKFHTVFIIYSLASRRSKKDPLEAWVISSKKELIQSVLLTSFDTTFLTPDQVFKGFPYAVATKRPCRRNQGIVREEKLPTQLFDENLSSWYNCLIAPLEKYLPEKGSEETLTFISEGFLTHLPFGAFYNQKKDFYLIEKYPISVAPSLKVLSLLDELPKDLGHEVLLMGNPTTLDKEIDALPLAEKEVRDTIAPMLGITENLVLIHEKATPKYVLNQASSAKIVHIACHGIAHQKPLEKPDPNSVFEGLFKLAPDDEHSMGHLHAEEIASMNLKTDLVFMSACHLGRGNLKKEGSIGPVWSFLGSGAKSIIASYWPLPEGEITVKMVETFYHHYLGIDTPKVNKAKALQQAVLMAMKTERNKPRQWGAFFLSGLIE
ncbi:MAG: tetratricopeptide repeat protein [Candidatus Rhabdochlamydia sp.]